jgi:hypothetical protein
MARKPSALAGIFDDEPTDLIPVAIPVADVIPLAPSAPVRRSSHPGKKPVLIHIPEDMHRALRQLSVEEGGEPLTVVTERLLRQYLVKRGHTRFAP